MTATTMLPTLAHLGLVLNHMLVDIRNMAFADDFDPKELAEIADVAEIIPLQFINQDDGYLRAIVSGIHGLAAKYPRASRYCHDLDMTPDEVTAHVLPKDSIDWTGTNN